MLTRGEWTTLVYDRVIVAEEALLFPGVHKREYLEARVLLVPLVEATVLDHDECVPPCRVTVPQIEAFLVPHLPNRAVAHAHSVVKAALNGGGEQQHDTGVVDAVARPAWRWILS